MAEYCTVTFSSWKPDSDYSSVVEYVFDNREREDRHKQRPHLKDHLSLLGTSHTLQVSKQHESTSEDDQHCIITFQCKPICDVAIVSLAVASEARTIEVYDAKDGSYLETVRGTRDTEDSEADNSIIHFMCHCTLAEPLLGIKIKFLSLGFREFFEISCIKLLLQPHPVSSTQYGQSVDMEKLRRDIDSMGDSVSDRARAFLTTLEQYQKSKTKAVEDLRHLLVDENLQAGASTEAKSMASMTTLLSMMARSQGTAQSQVHTEGSLVNNMLTQMMVSMSTQQNPEARPEKDDMYRFLQSVCGQVNEMRATDEKQMSGTAHNQDDTDAGHVTDDSKSTGAQSSVELDSKVAARVEALVETKLSVVEQHIKEEVDQRMEEMETRMTNKLDAIFALLQNSQKQS